MSGSAVLVHGSWGHPQDWRWVQEALEGHGVSVHTPDLPSHRFATAGLTDDVVSVVEAIRSAVPPVVVVGWSYGAEVAGEAAATGVPLVRLVYVSALPDPPWPSEGTLADWIASDPHLRSLADGTFVLDDVWWLTQELGATFPAAVQEHLWRYRRRSVSLLVEGEHRFPAAWKRLPTTVVLGTSDEFVSDRHREWALEHLSDVRLIDTDHFILWRQPIVVTDVILESLSSADAHTAGFSIT